MKKNNNTTSLEDFVTEEFGAKGTASRKKYEKGLNDIQRSFNIGLGWFPSGENAMKIIDAINRKNNMIK